MSRPEFHTRQAVPVEAPAAAWLAPYWRLLAGNPIYRLLCIEYVASLVGDAVNLIAVLALLREATSSSLALSAILAVRQIPYFLWAPLTGFIADHYNKTHVMMIADGVRTVLVLAYLLVSRDQLWLLFILHSLSALFEPSYQSSIPLCVSKHELVYANAISTALWSSVVAVASAVGGLFVNFFGPTPNFLLDSACYLLSLALLWRIRTLQLEKDYDYDELEEEEDTATLTVSNRSSFDGSGVDEELDDLSGAEHDVNRDSRDESEVCAVIHVESSNEFAKAAIQSSTAIDSFWEVFKFLRGSPYLVALIAQKMIDSLVYGAVTMIAVLLAEGDLVLGGSPSLTVALLYVVLGLASFLGPFFGQRSTATDSSRIHATIVLFSTLQTVAVWLLSWSPSPLILYVSCAVHVAAMSGNFVFVSTLMQLLVPPSLYGRVAALENAIGTLVEVGGMFLCAFLEDDLAVPPRSLALGVAGVAACGVLFSQIAFNFVFGPHLAAEAHASHHKL